MDQSSPSYLLYSNILRILLQNYIIYENMKQQVSSYWRYAAILLLIFITVTIVLNSVIRSSFYSQSLNFISNFQSIGNNHLSTFMNLVSILLNTNFLIAFLAVIYICHKKKVAAIVFITNFLINVYFMNILKFSYQQQRPFWYDQKIQQLEWGCPSQFGNPSGHSWFVIIIYEPLITDFTGTGFWNLGYIFPILATVIVPISRMYLGAHAGNEVVMGVTLGVIMCTLYRLKIQEWIYKLYFYLDSKKVTMWGYIILVFLNFIVVVAPIIIHSVNVTSRPINQIYLDNLNKACGKHQTSAKIQQGAMEAHAIVNVLFGFIFGTAVSDQTNFYYFLGEWMFTSIQWPGKVLKFFYKVILQIIIVAPFPIVLSFIIPKFVEISPYVKYLIGCLGFWLLGFLLMAFSNRLLLKSRVIIHYQEEAKGEKEKMHVNSQDILVSESL